MDLVRKYWLFRLKLLIKFAEKTMDLIISQNGYSDYKRKVLDDNESNSEDQSILEEYMQATSAL
jgi:hypothetical protein